MQQILKGRGAQINLPNKYHQNNEVGLNLTQLNEEGELKTEYINTYPKTILNKVNSPDVPFYYSANPYQGCEHGCIYCYARPTHNYWGYSSGVDFEQKILIKQNAVALLKKQITNPKWKAVPIALSGNTDCYQPAEVKYKITRSILELALKHKHPVSIITKNALILRDMDIIKKLNNDNLVSVAISITTLNKSLQKVLEPRTSIPAQRMNIIKSLSDFDIPVITMMAPIIPGLNDHEIFNIAEESANNGALDMHYTLVRLNDDLDLLFEDWLNKHFPDRKDKILNHIRNSRNGKLSATIKENRMKGSGKIADIIRDQVNLAKKKYFSDSQKIELNTTIHNDHKTDQLSLF